MALSTGKPALKAAMQNLAQINDSEQQDQAIDNFIDALIVFIQTATINVTTSVSIPLGQPVLAPPPTGVGATTAPWTGTGTGTGTLT